MTYTEEYLRGRGGSPEQFRENISQGQSIGEAFFNALNEKDQRSLRNSGMDTCYIIHGPAMMPVIEFLMDT